jgi:hypothetical protein
MKMFLHFYMVFCFLVLFTGCATTGGGGSHSSVPEKAKITSLEWHPTMKLSDLDEASISVFRSITVTIVALEDVRENVNIIGKVPEDMRVRDTFIPVTTKRNVAKWCNTALHKSFSMMGIPTTSKKGQLLLEIDLTEVMINDDITQSATVGLRVSARNKEDMLIWEGRISGKSDLYTKPKDSNGISECLSNTVLVTLQNLLKEQSFRDAVVKSFELQNP